MRAIGGGGAQAVFEAGRCPLHRWEAACSPLHAHRRAAPGRRHDAVPVGLVAQGRLMTRAALEGCWARGSVLQAVFIFSVILL